MKNTLIKLCAEHTVIVCVPGLWKADKYRGLKLSRRDYGEKQNRQSEQDRGSNLDEETKLDETH